MSCFLLFQACELLVDAGANIDAVDNEERTPLHLAALSGRLDALESLLAASPNALILDRCFFYLKFLFVLGLGLIGYRFGCNLLHLACSASVDGNLPPIASRVSL